MKAASKHHYLLAKPEHFDTQGLAHLIRIIEPTTPEAEAREIATRCISILKNQLTDVTTIVSQQALPIPLTERGINDREVRAAAKNERIEAAYTKILSTLSQELSPALIGILMVNNFWWYPYAPLIREA